MRLKVDQRESAEPRLARTLSKYAEVDIQTLELGDVTSDNCYIERKTLQDYVQSLIDGRLFSQMERLFTTGKPAFLIIHHEEPTTEKGKWIYQKTISRITKEQLYGSMAAIIVEYGIPIITFNLPATFEDMVYCLVKMIEKVEQGKFLVPRRLYKRKERKVPFCVTLVKRLFGVPERVAVNLLKEFGSIENMCQAKEEDFLNVPGMGNVRSLKAVTILHKDWRKKN